MNWVVVILCTLSAALAAPQYSGAGNHRHLAAAPAVPAYQGPPVVPVILPGGFIADTEEVARAKELHFNAFANAATKVKDSKYQPYQPSYSDEQPRYTAVAQQHQQQLYTPVPAPAPAPVARQQNYNVPQHRYTGPAADAANYAPSQVYQPQSRYQGPPVVPVVLANGYIAETADVEAAKQHHFQLFAAAQAAAARAQERAGANKYAGASKYAYTAAPASTYSDEDDGQYNQYEEQDQRYNQVYQGAGQQKTGYRGTPVVPVLLPTGHIADTAEVAAAKISHLQQLLDAAQRSLPQHQQRYR